ncbi:MAG TPA: hypothetical protein VIX80_09355, partial [Candidatus Kapabacteria bacterium]
MRSLTLCILLFSYIAASAQEWKQLPGPYAGSFGDLQITKNGTIFGTAAGKLWKRPAGSKTWKSIDLDSITNDPGRVPTLIYTDIGGCHLFTLTNFPNSRRPSDGIYRSTNNGDTWVQVLINKPVSKIVSDNKGTHYALRDWTNFTSGVFRSLDSGITWDSIASISLVVTDIAADSSKLYFTLDLYKKDILVYNPTSALFTSLQLPDTIFKVRPHIYNYHNNILIKSSYNIYVIRNDTSIVKNSSTGTHPEGIKNIFYKTPSNELCIIAGNNDTTYDYQLLVSSDTGRTWKPYLDSLPITKSQVTTYAFDSNSAKVFCGTEKGIYETDNIGKSWQGIGLPISALSGIQKDPTGGLFVLENINSAPGYQRVISFDEGVTWRTPNEIPGNGYGMFVYDSNGGNYYFLRDPGYPHLWYADKATPYSFEDHGESPSMPDSWRVPIIYKNSIISQTHVTTDKGNTWNNFFTPELHFGDATTVLALDKHNRFYAGSYLELHYSDNEGMSWTKLATPFKNTPIWCIKFDTHDYIVLMSRVNGKTNLWKSSDRGASWQLWDSTNFTSIREFEIIGDTCYLGTPSGLYYCALNSSDWKEIILTTSKADIIDIDYIDNKRLYVAVSGGGIWYKDIIATGTNAVKIIKDNSASIVVSPEKNSIAVQLNHATYATIDIHDILGKQVTSVFKGMIDKGSTTV